jgi:acetolactate synthase small subunit
MAYFLINRNDKITTNMAENTSRMEAAQMVAEVAEVAEVAASKVARIVEVASVADKTSSTSICNRLMKYLDSFLEVKILFPTSSMMKKISLGALQDSDKWEWALICRETNYNNLVVVVKTEIHSAWVILLEAWEEASMIKTFSAAVVDSEACK